MSWIHSSFLAAWLALVLFGSCVSQWCIVDKERRFDCHPDPSPSADNCKSRGCCWQPVKANETRQTVDVPFCYFPGGYNGYSLMTWKETDYGYTASLSRSTLSGWPNDVKTLTVDVWFETDKRVHFKIYDPSTSRYEVPIETPAVPKKKASNPEYGVKYNAVPFGITIYRKSNNAVLFDSTINAAALIFADQFLQISSSLSTDLVYGLGGRKATLLHNASSWQQFSMWARDQPPSFNSNLYGSHPFYLNVEKDGQTHGVFLLNSNAMDVVLQPTPAITFRSIGGILDFYVFTGPTSKEVIEQYTQVIGRPQMPPYWALGFHLCRYNYKYVDTLKMIIKRNRKLGIPYEVQWTDIDYMKKHLDWTYDTNAYAGLPAVVKDLHDHGQKYIVIVDPGISNQYVGRYKPYDSGLEAGVFVLNASGAPLVGKVWPGQTVFPDFTHPKAVEWWYNQMKDFHDVVPFDGLWTDMNEPSNFVDGSFDGCTTNTLDRPPYVPGISGNGRLEYGTVCPSAKHYLSSHYNLHNLYGLTEANATNSGLRKLLGRRSLVISRSSFPSLGRFGGHWSGDISSTWEDLYYSIPAILEYQFYGIPMVGADICGFQHDTTEELCVRWMQLGAFYPFMRNHNDDTSKDQDPGAFSTSAQQIMKTVTLWRYLLLPYMYTRFYLSHITGSTVLQPLFFQYPNDSRTYSIDKQFMWGSELLISPVLDQGRTSVDAYFPKDSWYDFYTGEPFTGRGDYTTLKAPLETINVHVRGGSILPLQKPDVSTTLSRQHPFGLLVAFNTSKKASGALFWDDGDSLCSLETGQYNYVIFNADQGSIVSAIVHGGYSLWPGMILDHVYIYGLSNAPTSVTVNDKAASFRYDASTQKLIIESFQANLLKPLTIKWK